MTAYDDDAALMADLMHGRGGRIGFTDPGRKLTTQEFQQMDEVIDHLRDKVTDMIEELRGWRIRHGALKTKIGRHYSAYEGFFARHNLRLYWLLYRGAVRVRCGKEANENRRRAS
jgi:hypothetical protein